MDRIRYFVGVILVVSLPPAVIWWYIVHPFVGFWRRLGRRWAVAVNTAIAVVITAGLWFVRRPLLGPDMGTHWSLVALGAVLVLVGVYIGLQRRKQLSRKILSGYPELEKDGKGGILLTEGLYARLRNPRYVEVSAFVFGYAALANHLGAWIMAVANLPALHLVVLLEERELARRFGAEYDAYRARVPRYIPRRSSAEGGAPG